MDRAEFRRLQAILEPCLTPDDLDKFLVTHWNVRLPWDIVDEESTSAPLQFMWSVYNVFLTGKGCHRHVLACSRNAYKTLTSSLIQTLSMLHFRRDGIHIAALLSQAGAAISYMDQFIGLPELEPFRSNDSTRIKGFANLPPNDVTTRSHAKLLVVTATKKGANAPRASCLDGNTKVLMVNQTARLMRHQAVTIREIHRKIQQGIEVSVLSANPQTGALEEKKVLGSKRSVNHERIQIITKSDHRIHSTPDHWHATGFRDDSLWYTQASDLVVGDSLLVRHGSRLALSEIHSIKTYTAQKRSKWVYDITVEDSHNFFANGILTHNCLTFDEVDLTPPAVLAEAAYIADPANYTRPDIDEFIRREQEMFKNFSPESVNEFYKAPIATHDHRSAISIYLSSRKSNNGPIQDLIDEAEAQPADITEKNVYLHKWSTADMMRTCKPEVHKPELGSFNAYVHSDTLETIWSQDQFNQLDDHQKEVYKTYKGFEGCRTCPVWTVCLGRSPKQRGLSPGLRTIQDVRDLLQNVSAAKDPSIIVAQSLNWKPETTGIVFRSFNYHKHVMDARRFFRWVAGFVFDPDDVGTQELENIIQGGSPLAIRKITPTKEQIYSAMTKTGWAMVAGSDFGFNPDPATAVVIGYHKTRHLMAILHVEASTGFANHLWAKHFAKHIYPKFPVQFMGSDQNNDPSSPSYFTKYKIPSLDKKNKPKRIFTGVSFIRGMLFDPEEQISRFAILDDSTSDNYLTIQGFEGKTGSQLMVHEFMNWTHARDALGRWRFDKFDEDKNNHTLDAIRYGVHPFTKEKTALARSSQPVEADNPHKLQKLAIMGDQNAIAILKDRDNLQSAMNQHFTQQLGIPGAFGPKPKVDGEDGEGTGRESGAKRIKFRF